MVSALIESNAVEVGEIAYEVVHLRSIKDEPSVRRDVSLVDSDEEVEESTWAAAHDNEARDSVFADTLADDLFVDRRLFVLEESCEEERDDQVVSTKRIVHPPNTTPLTVLPDSHVSSPEIGCESYENSAICFSAWANPANLLGNENNDRDADDDESVGSTSIVGKMFDDLMSLPSLSAFGFKASSSGKKEQGDEDTDASLGELSTMLDTKNDETAGAAEMNDEAMEKAIEMKLSELNVYEKGSDNEMELSLVRSKSTPVRSTTAYLRSNSAPVCHTDSAGASQTASVAGSSKSTRKALAQELCDARDTYGRYDLKCANILLRLANTVYEEGDYERALTAYKEVSSIYSTKLGDIHVITIDSNVYAGETLVTLGRYDEAIQVLYSVLEKRRDLNGDQCSSVADTLVLISRALQHKKGRLSQALKELKRALKLYRSSLGDKDPKVSATVDDIAALYMANGNFVKAALILDEVVKLKTATNGLYNAEVAGSLTLLGIAQQSSGETANALKSLKKAYSIYLSIEGDAGEQTILALERMAGIYREGKDHNRAIGVYMAVLKAKKMKLKDMDPSVADTYTDLGLCLRDKGDLEKATKCLKQSLTIFVKEKTFGNIKKIAQAMHELGIVHQLRGQARDALKTFKQELAIRRTMGPIELPQVARTLFYLGTVKYDRNDYPAALTFLTEALSIYEKLDDDVGLDYAETLVSIGLLFKATQRVDKAYQTFLKSLKLFHAHGLGSDHELVKMAGAKLKELGHKCECKGGKCNQVPCKTLYGTINSLEFKSLPGK